MCVNGSVDTQERAVGIKIQRADDERKGRALHTSTLTGDEGSLLCERVGSVATVAGVRISNEERQVRKRVTEPALQ